MDALVYTDGVGGYRLVYDRGSPLSTPGGPPNRVDHFRKDEGEDYRRFHGGGSGLRRLRTRTLTFVSVVPQTPTSQVGPRESSCGPLRNTWRTLTLERVDSPGSGGRTRVGKKGGWGSRKGAPVPVGTQFPDGSGVKDDCRGEGVRNRTPIRVTSEPGGNPSVCVPLRGLQVPPDPSPSDPLRTVDLY